MTPDEIRVAWVYAQQLWPAFDIPADPRLEAVKLQAWLDVVGDLEMPLVRAALARLAADQFPPPPGRIRQEAVRLASPAVPDVDQAWAEVVDGIRRHGRAERPEFSHPLIAAAVDGMGGWLALCQSENPVADRAHFLKLYGVATIRQERDAAVSPAVAGLVEGVRAALAGRQKELEA